MPLLDQKHFSTRVWKAKIIDAKSTNSSANMSLMRHALLEKPYLERFRWSQVRWRSSAFMQLAHCCKTDDGNDANRGSHWQKTLKKIHYIKFARRLNYGKANTKQWWDTTVSKREDSWGYCIKNIGRNFGINFQYPNYASSPEARVNSLLSFCLLYATWKVLF